MIDERKYRIVGVPSELLSQENLGRYSSQFPVLFTFLFRSNPNFSIPLSYDASMESTISYINRIRQMHFDSKNTQGGSKFIGQLDSDGKLTELDFFSLLEDLLKRHEADIRNRVDDREELIDDGVPESALLGVDRCLYYTFDAAGELNIIRLGDLADDTPICVMIEKGKNISFGVVQDNNSVPKQVTTSGTMIIGFGDNGPELWTVHPGNPIRPSTLLTIDGKESLVSQLTDPSKYFVVPASLLKSHPELGPDKFIKVLGSYPGQLVS